ncbi:MAG: hypothetical protein WC773_02620 [Patescibacteria group bacterium]|jgi:deoxyadenosine/deoxycytidine kinase
MIIFISGLSGTGKSALCEYFRNHPISGWSFYDFDKGNEKCPEDQTEHLSWRTRQMEYWLGVAKDDQNTNTMIFGLTIYPNQIMDLAKQRQIDPKTIHCALIDCASDERKSRIFKRGTPQHWQGHKDWYDEFYTVMRNECENEFNTTNKSVEKSAKEIRDWITSLG